LESAIAQPRASFGGNDLYPSLEEKAAALAFSLIQNHPFVAVINELVMRRLKRSLF
jgi:death-on-curing protein